jgi:hypothetical protein
LANTPGRQLEDGPWNHHLISKNDDNKKFLDFYLSVYNNPGKQRTIDVSASKEYRDLLIEMRKANMGWSDLELFCLERLILFSPALLRLSSEMETDYIKKEEETALLIELQKTIDEHISSSSSSSSSSDNIVLARSLFIEDRLTSLFGAMLSSRLKEENDESSRNALKHSYGAMLESARGQINHGVRMTALRGMGGVKRGFSMFEEDSKIWDNHINKQFKKQIDELRAERSLMQAALPDDFPPPPTWPLNYPPPPPGWKLIRG